MLCQGITVTDIFSIRITESMLTRTKRRIFSY